MKASSSEAYILDNFEGPLDLLWQLINRQEIDIYEVSLKTIIDQFLIACRQQIPVSLDQGAEFVSMASLLVWFKSKTLLPKHEQQDEEILSEEEFDSRFEIIHQLLDYCRFKQAAKALTQREHLQNAYYARGTEENEIKKNLGINHLSLEDLASLFRQILAKAVVNRGVIQEEIWRVADKIKALRYLLKEKKSILFTEVFSPEKSREELIVTFLALLELMKSGEARVVQDIAKNAICIQSV